MEDITTYPKDPALKGIYVKRCKCGARPYLDRVACGQPVYWIACNCGKESVSSLDKQETIDNWNKDILAYKE